MSQFLNLFLFFFLSHFVFYNFTQKSKYFILCLNEGNAIKYSRMKSNKTLFFFLFVICFKTEISKSFYIAQSKVGEKEKIKHELFNLVIE